MGQSLLPVVSEGTYDSVTQSLNEDYESDYKFLRHYLPKLKEENPEVLRFIFFCAEHHSKAVERHRCIVTMLVMYRLLESQAEAKELEELFGD